MNVTLSIDDQLVEKAREVAASQGTSLDQLIQKLLEDMTASPQRETRLAELERLWKESSGDSKGRAWKREDLYDRAVLR